MIPPVLDLLAGVVRYDENKRKHTDFDSPVYDVMPTVFIDFANGSRKSEGYCLLKRCLRHSFDPKCPPTYGTRSNPIYK